MFNLFLILIWFLQYFLVILRLNLTIIQRQLFSIVIRIYSILVFCLLLCIGCQWQLRPQDASAEHASVSIQRYDRIESLYLTTGDYSAMQQMNVNFPMQTRMLIEDVLKLGKVNDADINTKFLYFFQDSTLQAMLSAVQQQYGEMDDVSDALNSAFTHLQEQLPDIEIPLVYTQIGSFDQSIIVGYNTLGISLDKYLGADYPFYVDHYSDEQRRMMVREMIVPDCLSFYLLSLYPLPARQSSQYERDVHMGRIQWVVNHLLGRSVFDNDIVAAIDRLMNGADAPSLDRLLRGAGDAVAD